MNIFELVKTELINKEYSNIINEKLPGMKRHTIGLQMVGTNIRQQIKALVANVIYTLKFFNCHENSLLYLDYEIMIIENQNRFQLGFYRMS